MRAEIRAWVPWNKRGRAAMIGGAPSIVSLKGGVSLKRRAMRRALLIAVLCACGALAHAATEPILDTMRLPSMRPGGSEAYTGRFLLGDLPRAWAVASNGWYGGQWGGDTIAEMRDGALKSCASKGGTDCAIYAEDLDVVWHGRQPLARPQQPAIIAERGYEVVPDRRFFWFGPQAAEGVVLFGHGFGGAKADYRGSQPPGYLRALNDVGYDVIRFDRDPGWDHDPDLVATWLRGALAELRRRGWRTIVSAGQSRGAWNALQMLATPGAADAIIAASPAQSGVDPGWLILNGETSFYSLLAGIPRQSTRVAFIQFREDPFAGGEERRAERVRRMLAPQVGAMLMIDRPDGLKGHGAAASTDFAVRFGNCIMHFVRDPNPPTGCAQ
jgi:hypothetical protein